MQKHITLFFYRLAIAFYALSAHILSRWNAKARLFVAGRYETFEKIQLFNQKRAQEKQKRPVFWLHAASLGEFEQGRPVLEGFKAKNPHFLIVVTFFSPSGYEQRKNYALADLICYLPFDTPENMAYFIGELKPNLAVFVKYEFWYYLLAELKHKNVPTFLIAANFRRNQLFFKPYGHVFLEILNSYAHIFVQKQDSIDILTHFGIKNASVAGDTRLDRAIQVSKQAKTYPIIANFLQKAPKNDEKKHFSLVCGSTWAEDEAVILDFLEQMKQQNSDIILKIIIAPHELNPKKIAQLIQKAQSKNHKIVPYSAAPSTLAQNLAEADLLLIDNIGMLASLYQYGDFAYIGGAFGGGLHNIIEAAVFGVPIFFGNKTYKKFGESLDLIATGGAFPVQNSDELTTIFATLRNETAYTRAAAAAQNYVINNQGATQKILYRLDELH